MPSGKLWPKHDIILSIKSYKLTNEDWIFMALGCKSFIFAYYLIIGTILGININSTNFCMEKVSTHVWLDVNQCQYVLILKIYTPLNVRT